MAELKVSLPVLGIDSKDNFQAAVGIVPEAPPTDFVDTPAPKDYGRVFEVFPIVKFLASSFESKNNTPQDNAWLQKYRHFWTRLTLAFVAASNENDHVKRAENYAFAFNTQMGEGVWYLKPELWTFPKENSPKLTQSYFLELIREVNPTVVAVRGHLFDSLHLNLNRTIARVGGYDGNYKYIPMNQYVYTDENKKTVPCGYEESVKRYPGYWMISCTRTRDPNTKKCSMFRVNDYRKEIVPVECKTSTMTIVDGVRVESQSREFPDGTTIRVDTPVVSSQVIQTQIPVKRDEASKISWPASDSEKKSFETFDANNYSQSALFPSNVRMGGAKGTKSSNSSDTKINKNNKSNPNNTESKTAKITKSTQSTKSTKSTKSGGSQVAGAQVGGAGAAQANIPSKGALQNLAQRNIKINDLDLPYLSMPSNPNAPLLPEPEQWRDLPALGNNEFYAFINPDSQHESNRRLPLTEGFAFDLRHQPISFLRLDDAKRYFEWLIGVTYNLRAMYHTIFEKIYDAHEDTIAILESYILKCLSNLESLKKPFDRNKLWQEHSIAKKTVEPWEPIMNSTLYQYVTNPPTMVWDSPIEFRNHPIPPAPTDGSEDVAKFERDQYQYLGQALETFQDLIKNGLPLVPGSAENVILPIIPRDGYDNSNEIRAIREDILMAFLADLQYRHGYAVNFWFKNASAPNSEFTPYGISRLMFSPECKRYLSKHLVDYIDTFGNPDERAPFLVRLDKARMDAVNRKLKANAEK